MKLYTLFSYLLSPYVFSVAIAIFIAIVVMRRRTQVFTENDEQELFRP